MKPEILRFLLSRFARVLWKQINTLRTGILKNKPASTDYPFRNNVFKEENFLSPLFFRLSKFD